MLKTLTAITFTFVASFALAEQLPYQDPNLSSEVRAKDLISRLTLEEKTQLMCDESKAIPHLGIKTFNWWSEALHGMAYGTNVTVLPEPIGMAASFDEELVHDAFEAVSDEFRATYHERSRNGLENQRNLSLSVWTPNINIFRDPRWGRGQETYGEDPYLTSRLGIAVVNGLQGPADAKYRKLLACAKHFAVHSGPEWSRHTLNLNNIDPRDLWETYLPAFKALVQEADVREVMCAYQRFDDEPCCGSTRLLQKILRDDWGFKYLVVSDCGAIADFYTNHKVSSDDIHAAAKGVLAGTDVECGFGYAYDKLEIAVDLGLLDEADIDEHLMRILVGRFDLGEMDDDSLVEWSRIPASVIDSKPHRELALKMARETMTLLLNRNGVLPLSKSIERLAVIGPNANDEAMLWGNYNGFPSETTSVLEGIAAKLSPDQILYEKGCDLTEGTITEDLLEACSFEGKPGLKATFWNNRDFAGEPVATDRLLTPIQVTTAGQHTFSQGVNLRGFTARYQTHYTATRDEELVFKLVFIGRCELRVNGETLMKKDSFHHAPVRIPLAVESGKEYRIEFDFKQDFDWTDASLNLTFGREHPVDFDQLIAKLDGIDTVVFVGGLSSKLEGEEMAVEIPGFKGGDRTDIELPASQRNCLQALKDAGKKVVFVNCSGSAIALSPETESCDAILQAWYGGQAGGQAVADVLFGDYNPSGKLPISFYRDSSKLGDFEDYSMKGRTYRFTDDVLFPFGYGLSYTNFTFGKASLSKATINTDETILLTVPVSNTGKRDGTEVLQVYVRKVGDTNGPLKTLRGFTRIELAAGQTQQAMVALSPAAFEFYDRSLRAMAVTPGQYEILYGNSSAANALQSTSLTILR